MTIEQISESQFLDLIFTEDVPTIAQFLNEHGLIAAINDKGILIIHNPVAGLKVGIDWAMTDCPTRKTQLGVAMFGLPSLMGSRYPTLDNAIQQRWTKECKSAQHPTA